MAITRYKNEKDLAEKFQLDEIKCYSLVPGVAKEIGDFKSNLDYSFMSSFTLKKELEKVFGKSKYLIDGKEQKASCIAFEFREKILFCICENDDIGTGWYLTSMENGSRYGNPMLLPFDKEVKDFWPDFCSELKEAIGYKPSSKMKM